MKSHVAAEYPEYILQPELPATGLCTLGWLERAMARGAIAAALLLGALGGASDAGSWKTRVFHSIHG